MYSLSQARNQEVRPCFALVLDSLQTQSHPTARALCPHRAYCLPTGTLPPEPAFVAQESEVIRLSCLIEGSHSIQSTTLAAATAAEAVCICLTAMPSPVLAVHSRHSLYHAPCGLLEISSV